MGQQDRGAVTDTEPALSRWRWLFYAAGTAMILFGLRGQLFGADTNPRRYGELLVAAALAHDLLVAPVVLVLGLIGRRALNRRIRSSVQGAAVIGFVLLLIAVPGIGRYGARPDNPSVLPRDYPAGLLVYLGLLAVATATYVAFRKRRRG